MKVKIAMKGMKELKAALQAAKTEAYQATAAAMYVAANEIMTEAKQRAPIDTGVLRSSGYVTLPVPGPNPKVELGFGGAAAQYALVQHERTEYRHEVGEAKYLENAINATDVQGIVEEEFARRIEVPGQGIPLGPHNTEPE